MLIIMLNICASVFMLHLQISIIMGKYLVAIAQTLI